MQSSIANAAGVSSSAVVITVEVASVTSVRITVSITLDAGMEAPVMEALSKSFATPDDASALLGITVLDVLSLESTNVGAPSPPLTLPTASSESGSGEDSSLALMLVGAGALLLAALVLLVAAFLFRSAQR